MVHPIAAIIPSQIPSSGSLGECKPIQTSVDACAAWKGDTDATVRTLWHVATRTGLFALAMYPFEKDYKKLFQQALGGSLAVETFVWGWNWATNCEPLPSGQVACDFCEHKEGSMAGVLGTVAFRSAIIGTGIALWGEHRPKELFKKTVASVTLLELTILANAMAERDEPAK